MINLQHYLDPVSIARPVFEHLHGHAGFPSGISIHTENSPVGDIGRFRIALLGVPEGRNSPSTGSGKGTDSIRSQLYSLSRIPGRLKMIDLGNMKQGTSFRDTLAGLTDVLVLLMEKNVFPLVFGGSSSLVPAFDKAFSRTGKKYSLIAVDSRIDYQNEKKETDSFNYLYGILHNNKSTLTHYTNIGYQIYLNDQQVVNRFLKRGFELIRTGDARKAIHLTEIGRAHV